MAEYSSIEWTDATWNPVTGCTKVSPGCKHCYAETFAERFRGVPGHPYEQGFDLRLWPERLELPLRWKERRKIFVNSMSDLFHKDVPDEFIGRVFDVMRQANWHIFQLLTKRPERMRVWSNQHFCSSDHSPNGKQVWPEQVWAGVSVETQAYVSRIRDLQQVPAKIRFLSIEPLLGPVELDGSLLDGIHWVVMLPICQGVIKRVVWLWVCSVPFDLFGASLNTRLPEPCSTQSISRTRSGSRSSGSLPRRSEFSSFFQSLSLAAEDLSDG